MDFTTYFRFLVALVFVLALIGMLAWVARRFGFLRGTVRPKAGRRRIEIVELAPVDSKRRLLLVRRDQTEHLVLLGANADLLLESGIAAPQGATEKVQ